MVFSPRVFLFGKRFSALIALGIACIVSGLAGLRLSQGPEKEAQKVADWFLNEKLKSERACDTVITAIEKQLPPSLFSKWNGKSGAHLALYKNRTPVYWNQNDYVPPHSLISEIENEGWVWLWNRRYYNIVKRTYQAKDTFTVVSWIPIYRRHFVPNGDLLNGYVWQAYSQTSAVLSGEGKDLFPVKDAAGKAIFLLKQNQSNPKASPESVWSLLLIGGILMVLTGSYLFILKLLRIQRRRQVLAFGIGLSCIWAGSALMYGMGLPYEWVKLSLFNPSARLSNSWVPLPGQWLWLFGTLTASGYLSIRFFFELPFWNRLEKWNPYLLSAISIALAFTGSGLFIFLRLAFEESFQQTRFSPDLTLLTDFQKDKIWGVILLWSALSAVFLHLHICIRSFYRFSIKSGKPQWLLLLLGVAIGALAFSNKYEWRWEEALIAFAFIAISIQAGLFRYVREQRYLLFIYLFTASMAFSISGVLAHVWIDNSGERVNKIRFAKQVLSENDPLAELLVQEMVRHIEADSWINYRWLDPYGTRRQIPGRIQRQHLDTYFDRFDLQITLYGPDGQSLVETPAEYSFNQLLESQSKPNLQTGYPNVFYSSQSPKGLLKHYWAYATLFYPGTKFILGHITLELRLKRLAYSGVFPQMLLAGSSRVAAGNRSFSFAVFDSLKLTNHNGAFDYERLFNLNYLKDSILYQEGMVINEVQHLGLPISKEKMIVVSSPIVPARQYWAIGGLLLFLQLLWVGFLLFAELITRKKAQSLTMAARIQLYLNAAFFVPLAVVCILALSVMAGTYRADMYDGFKKRTETLASLLSPALEKYQNKEFDIAQLNSELQTVARLNGLDISLFESNGNLLVSSQPLVYRRELLAPLADPIAMEQLGERRQASILIDENIEKRAYKGAWVAIRNPNTAKLMGMVTIPYFEASGELNHQLNDVSAIMLNVFSGLFVVFLGLSYYAAGQFTGPLRLIARKLRATGLGSGQKLIWDRNDEIGSLVSEYNRMLGKLEKSREALRQTEKESAWKDMARQVVHEIKNPLTPMKLTIQHLQRNLSQREDPESQKWKSAFQSLLNQIDTLDEIATSFSAFAQMPQPGIEAVDLVSLLNQLKEIHGLPEKGRFELHLPELEHPVWISGDKKLLGRILTNLIVNAFQAVPLEKEPFVGLELQLQKVGYAVVRVQDNGTGIAPEIKERIFQPAFSTKTGGMGIGLAVVRRGLEQMGGSITFETSDEGTCFIVSLKLWSDDDSGLIQST